MKKAFISNGMFTNQYDCEVRVTAAVVGAGENNVDLYSTVFTVQAGNLTFNLDPLLGKTRTINDIISKRGFLAGSTSGAVELNPKTTAITLKSDYVFLTADKKGTEMSQDILLGILKGEGFMTADGYKKVVGTNGTYKRGFNTNQNRFFGKLFELDGRLVIGDAATEDGYAVTVGNIRTPAYSKTCNFLIFEIITPYDDETVDGLRFVYTMNSDVNWGEDESANEITLSQTQLCDARIVKEFITDGYEEAEYGTDVPARRVRFAKRPVSMFKAVAAVDGSGALTGYTDADKTFEAGVAFEIPEKVVRIDLTQGDAVTDIYTPAVNDLVALFVPANATTTYGGYAMGVCTQEAQYTYTPVGTLTAVAGSTFTVAGDITTDIAANDVVRIEVDADVYEQYTVVSAVYDGTTETTVTVTQALSDNVSVGNGFDEVILDSGALFQVIKNDYLLKESDVYKDVEGNAPATLAEGLLFRFDYNFEETVFYQLD